MDVWILYNQDAGDGVSGESLRGLIERAGHRVLDIVTGDEASKDPARRPAEESAGLVVAAGGDGTVARAARLAAAARLPLAILPLGTANNVAASLDLGDDIERIVASWSRAARQPFDLGTVTAGPNEWTIVEGAGAGLVPAGIAGIHARPDGDPSSATMPPEDALHTFCRIFENLDPKHWTLFVDGERLEETLLMVEVLNIRSIGPNLVFSPSATPTDGWFDVVTATASDRASILDYLHRRCDGLDAAISLACRRARHVRFQTCDEIHIDDERVDTCGLGEVSILIRPAALDVLV